MIKDAGGKFKDYSISPKFRQILLHWGYELTEKYFLLPQQQFNRQEILQKAKDRYYKKEATKYYLKNKEAIKEKSKN